MFASVSVFKTQRLLRLLYRFGLAGKSETGTIAIKAVRPNGDVVNPLRSQFFADFFFGNLQYCVFRRKSHAGAVQVQECSVHVQVSVFTFDTFCGQCRERRYPSFRPIDDERVGFEPLAIAIRLPPVCVFFSAVIRRLNR